MTDVAMAKSVFNELTLNCILYGPPGSGKTYKVIEYAVNIIEKDNSNLKDLTRKEIIQLYEKYKEMGQIQFITFHQSYSYEEFIEGIKPKTNDDNTIGYEIEDGIFKSICNSAKVKIGGKRSNYNFDEKTNFFKMSLGNTLTDGDVKANYCIENNVIALGYGRDIDFSNAKSKEDIALLIEDKIKDEENSFRIEAVNRFINWMNIGDIVIVSQGNHKVKAIGRITSDYFYDDTRPIDFKHYRTVEWLYNDIIIPVYQIMNGKVFSQQTIYQLNIKDINISYIKSILSSEENDNKPIPHVLIIDEINRGNISKIFGELITLIEDDKRIGSLNELSVTLPYSKESFGIPANLYIVGTMNTADRSIALMDTALRRRFTFIEMMPDLTTISGPPIEGVRIDTMLEIINQRIEYLYDRDHQIGHAYFINIKSFDELKTVFRNRILPLLQEYFYDDWEKIRLVLNDHNKKDEKSQFILKTGEESDGKYRKKLFGSATSLDEYEARAVYKINEEAFNEQSSYTGIYSDSDENPD